MDDCIVLEMLPMVISSVHFQLVINFKVKKCRWHLREKQDVQEKKN